MKKKVIFLAGLLALMLAASTACLGSGTDSTASQSGSSINSTTEETTSSDSSENGDGSSETPVEGNCTVTFDADGGTAVAAATVKKGEKVARPADPQKISKEYEYEFLGWYYGDTEWDFENNAVTEDITLVAKWKLVGNYTKPFLPKN